MNATPDSTVANRNPKQMIADLQQRLAAAEAREAATTAVLQVINSSPGDLVPVFDAILRKATELCEATFGALETFDGGLLRVAATYQLPADLTDVVKTPQAAEEHSIRGMLLAGAPFVHQPDMLNSEIRVAPVRSAMVELGGSRANLAVALRKDNAFLGILWLHRQEPQPFTEAQIALMQNFAAQAVIAMENARLLNETREALEQQTATAEVLGVINSSPGDLAPVFDAMLEKAIWLCDAAQGVLWTIDGAGVKVAATSRIAPEFAELLRRVERGEHEVPPPLRQIMDGERLIHVGNLSEHELYRKGHPIARAALETAQVQSLVWVALTKDRTPVGAIVIARREVRPFSDKQIALLQNFAEQAVIAMENARLITETREALEQQTATAEVLQVINSSPGQLVPVFDALLVKALRLCDAAYGNLLSYDGKRFSIVAAVHSDGQIGAQQRSRPPFRIPPTSPLYGLVRGEQVEYRSDVRENPAYHEDGAYRAMVDSGGYRSVLNVALRKEGDLLGAIGIFRTEIRPFTDKQIALLQNFAAQAVIAMENARLLGELRQRTEDVAELNRGLEARVAEQVEELGRVGRLKRFLAPQLAELIVSQGDENILESHRREIVVVFCDLRGYTAFTETAEPEEVLDFLREYHGALGPLVSQFEGTLDQFSGDGIMVFFNDPVPITDSAERAVNMAIAMREAAAALIAAWRERGRELGFGAGIAQGYATLGQIGFSERSGYTAIGTVCNVAARLCAEAKDGQILLSQRVNVALKGSVATEQVGALALKGLTQPVVAYNVPLAATQPALRVIDGGPPGI